MNLHLISHLSPDRLDAIEKFLIEIHGAIGSLVARCAGCKNARYDQEVSHDSGATQEPAEITIRAISVDLGEVLRGHHFRAGRALLNWSMSDLADASRLSLSTVRRLEQDADAVLIRNRSSAAEALQDACICFFPLSNGAIAVVTLTDVVR